MWGNRSQLSVVDWYEKEMVLFQVKIINIDENLPAYLRECFGRICGYLVYIKSIDPRRLISSGNNLAFRSSLIQSETIFANSYLLGIFPDITRLAFLTEKLEPCKKLSAVSSDILMPK